LSTSRILAIANQKTLSRTKPSKVFVFKSMPCEEKAAAIRNKAIDSIERGDVAETAYRYLQSRAGVKDMILEGTLIILMTPFLCSGKGRFIIGGAFCSSTMLLIIKNIFKLRETRDYCDKWLSQHLDDESIKEIHQMYFIHSKRDLVNFFKEKNIDTKSIEKKVPFSFLPRHN